jgi:5'-3' exonuclease
MKAYRQACSTATACSQFALTDETGTMVQWGNVRRVFEHLAAYEHSNMIQEHTRRAQQEKRIKKAHSASQTVPHKNDNDRIDMFTNYVASIPIVRRNSEKRIDPFNAKWEARYYRELFGFNLDETALPVSKIGDDALVRGACVNYLESLEWTMRYYTKGCVDWAWRYRHQYAPLMTDLCRHTPGFSTRLLEEKPKEPIEPLSLLIYVSPKASLDRLLPPALVKRILSEHPEWYSDKWPFRWAYCKYFWESHAVMNEIDLDALRVVVQGEDC